MIKVNHIYKTFGTKASSLEILSNVSLSVSKGSWVSIVGPSGSGKSTLLNIISGLLQPNDGNVFFNNLDLYKLKAKERSNIRRKKIGFVFQDFKLLPYYSVLDNVTLPRYDEKAKGTLYKRAKEL